MNIKKGDNVIIRTGKAKGKQGKVVRAYPKQDRVLVENANTASKRSRARRDGEKGQVFEKPMPIHVSNVKKIDS